MNRFTRRPLAGLGLGLALLLANAAQAQNAEPRDDVEARYGILEEVVSTARKREEPLQETPVASTVLTSEALDLKFAPNLSAMPFLAPNVNMVNGLLTNVIYLSVRGYAVADVDSTLSIRPACGRHGQRHLLRAAGDEQPRHVRC